MKRQGEASVGKSLSDVKLVVFCKVGLIGELNTLFKSKEASLAKINGSAFSLGDKSVRGWSLVIPIRQKEGHLRA